MHPWPALSVYNNKVINYPHVADNRALSHDVESRSFSSRAAKLFFEYFLDRDDLRQGDCGGLQRDSIFGACLDSDGLLYTKLYSEV